MGGANGLDFSAGDPIRLDFSVAMKLIRLCGLSKMTSFQCGGSALVCFLCCGQNRLVLIVTIETNSVFVSGLVLIVTIETNSVFVSGHRNRLDIRGEIKIDLISVMGRN